MGLNVHYTLSCDHCGREAPVGMERFHETLDDAIAVANLEDDGWQKVEGDKVVCGECAPKLNAIASRYAREVAEFFGS